MTEASLEQSLAAARQEHLVPGREIHLQDVRGHRFCEVGLITGTNQDNAIVNIWNTTGMRGSRAIRRARRRPDRARERSRARLAQPGQAVDVRPA